MPLETTRLGRHTSGPTASRIEDAIRIEVSRDGECRLLASLASLFGGPCGLVGSTVVRATISPTAALLLPLVASLLAVCLVLHCCAGMMVMSDKITMAAADGINLGVENGTSLVAKAYLRTTCTCTCTCTCPCIVRRAPMVEPSAAAAVACLPDGCGSAREAASAAAASPASVTAPCTRRASLDADLPAAWRGTNEAVRDLHRNLHQIEVESGAFSPASTMPQPSRAEASSANRIQKSRTVQEWDVSSARFRLYPEIGTVCRAGLEPQARRRQAGLRLTRFEPRLGQASDLAKPGGFRRAYVIANDLSGSSSSPQLGSTARRAPEDEATRRRRAYAARPLTEHLQQGGGPLWRAFVTDVVQSLPDGTRHQAPSMLTT